MYDSPSIHNVKRRFRAIPLYRDCTEPSWVLRGTYRARRPSFTVPAVRYKAAPPSHVTPARPPQKRWGPDDVAIIKRYYGTEPLEKTKGRVGSYGDGLEQFIVRWRRAIRAGLPFLGETEMPPPFAYDPDADPEVWGYFRRRIQTANEIKRRHAELGLSDEESVLAFLGPNELDDGVPPIKFLDMDLEEDGYEWANN